MRSQADSAFTRIRCSSADDSKDQLAITAIHALLKEAKSLSRPSSCLNQLPQNLNDTQRREMRLISGRNQTGAKDTAGARLVENY